MKGEINRDFYCSAGMSGMCGEGVCSIFCDEITPGRCSNAHRKHPTPEQFEEEYGEEYPDGGAVYFNSGENNPWGNATYSWIKKALQTNETYYCVCACTPWGKPSVGWRME